MVYCYSFSKGRIDSFPSKTLFSKVNIWNHQLEAFFNDVSEKRISSSLDRLSHSSGDLEIDTRLHRSLIYYMIIHINRVEEFRNGGTNIDRFLSFTENDRIDLINYLTQKNDFIKLPINQNLKYFIPETCIFPFPVAYEKSKFDFGFAMPLSPCLAIGMVKKNWDRDFLTKLLNYRELMMSLSVGSPLVDRVVVHPKIRTALGNSISTSMINGRKQYEAIVRLLKNYNDLSFNKKEFFENIFNRD